MIQPEKFSLKQIVAIFFLSLVVGVLLVNWFEYIVPDDNSLPLGVDIYPRWVGTRAFWGGESPFSAATDAEIQSYVYGRAAFPGEATFGFYYPAHAAVVLGPLALLPAREAALFWTAFTWAILCVIVFMIVRSLPGRVSFWLLLLIALTILFQRSALLVVLNGQYVLFTLLCWGAAYYLIHREHETWAGVLLALTTIKPTLVALPLLVILFWAFRTDRGKVVVSFFLTSGLFFVVTLVQLGWWPSDFMAQLSQYGDYARQWMPADIFSLPGLVWLAGTAVLIVWGLKDFLSRSAEFPWILLWGSISLILLVTPHTAEYDLPVLLLPFIVYAPRFLQSKSGTAVWAILLWLPWLTWGGVTLLGQTTAYWYSIYWFHYPQILIVTLIVFLVVTKRNTPETASLYDSRTGERAVGQL